MGDMKDAIWNATVEGTRLLLKRGDHGPFDVRAPSSRRPLYRAAGRCPARADT